MRFYGASLGVSVSKMRGIDLKPCNRPSETRGARPENGGGDCLSLSCRASLGLLVAVADGQRQARAFRLTTGRAEKSQKKAKARVSMKR